MTMKQLSRGQLREHCARGLAPLTEGEASLLLTRDSKMRARVAPSETIPSAHSHPFATPDGAMDRSPLPSDLHLLPITPASAIRTCQFPAGFPDDPAGRVIAATASDHQLTQGISKRRRLA